MVFFFVVLIPLFVGCGESGPELAPVTGRITLNGAPLKDADLVFQPEDSKPPSFGRTESDGSYVLAYKRGIMGARVGPHTVRITVSNEVVPNPPKIAPRYNTQSELRAEVKAGEDNVFDFDVSVETK